MKRFLILILSLALIACSFVSCSELGSYSVNSKTVMTVGGVKVSYDMYKFCYNMALQEMGEAFDPLSSEDMEKLRESAMDSVRLYCAKDIFFDMYEIELTRDDKGDLDAEIQSYIDEQNGMDGYKKWLSENHVSGKFFREQIERIYYLDPYLRDILFTGIDGLIKMDDDTIISDIEENFYRYTQVFVSCGEDENYLEKYMQINSAYEALKNGEDFLSVALQYSEWSANTEQGVYSTKGEKLIEIEEAVLGLEISESLNEGPYSEIIQTYEGFHIIKRLPLDSEYINSHLDDLAYISATRRYNELIEEKAAGLEVSYKDYFFELTHEKLTEIEYA